MTWHYIVLALCAVGFIGGCIWYLVANLPCLSKFFVDSEYDKRANELGDV